MVKRKIIRINEALCDGCALCIPSCPEGALQIIDGKARLVRDSYCDGLGACLGECPQGALSITEMMVEDFDELGVKNHMAGISHGSSQGNPTLVKESIKIRERTPHAHQPAGCPSTRSMELNSQHLTRTGTESKLRQWPVQLQLVPPFAPYFANADLYLIADCVPFAYPNFHDEFLDNHAIAVACPKLDNTEPYVQKVTNIIKASSIKSLTVVIMEVPCCSGLVHITREAILQAGADIPLEVIVVGIQGDILKKSAI